MSKPWIGNNQFLLDIADSIGYGQTALPKSATGGFDAMADYWIPVKAWVYNDDNGDGGITEIEVEESIRRLNEYLAGEVNDNGNAHSHMKMQFYLRCAIEYVNNSTYSDNPSNNEIDAMWNSNHETAAMNIHFIQSHNSLAGKGRFPGSTKSFTCLVTTNNNHHLDGVLPHEVGHAFDVVHTHQGRCSGNNSDCGNCRQEAVSRAKIQPVGCFNFSGSLKCEVNGDGYCDTEADPNINFQIALQGGQFVYIGGGSDNWDDFWTPDVFNIMSYSLPNITERFSTSQIATMYYWVLGLMHPLVFPSQLHLHINNEFVDIYEPDNFRHINDINIIGINETQHRGLHAERFGFKSNPQFGYCDEDWVRLVIPVTQRVNISTHAVPGRPNVNTEIFLFDEDGTQLLASNDDKEVGDIYSEIPEFELTSGTYWIQVVSVGNTSGEYYINVERCAEECCFQPLIGTTTVIDGVTGPFNLGAVEQVYTDYLGNSLNVSSLLAFNSNLPLGFGGAGFPVPSSELDAIICNEAQIQISSGAIMIIGDNPSNRTAQVTFQEGSKLIVNPYAELIVREGSKLIIESGAELRLNGGQVKVYDGGEIIVKEGGLLIYEDGVTLELNGNSAQLALGGHTHIGDDATFQFFWQGGESGYVRLLKEGHWGQRFSAGTNASVRLEGAGKEDLILHMEQDADFWEYSQSDNFQDHGLTSEDFALVLFKDGNIVCEKGSRFVFKAKTAFADVKIEQFSSLVGDRPRGIVTYAQLNFHQSDAYRIDIEGKFNVSGQGYLKFESSTFERSNISIRGGSFDIASSVFDNLSIEEEETVHTSRFTSSELSGWPSVIVSKSLQELRVVGSSVTYLTMGIQKHGGRLTVRCSEFRDNFEFSAISLFDNARLDMNLRNGAGYNVFQDNLSHIEVNYSEFNIDMGYNQFYLDAGNATPETRIIHGRVGYTPGSVQSDYLISANHNTWTSHGQSPNPAWPDPDAFEIEVWEPVQGNGMVMFYVPFDFGQVMPSTECGLYDYPADPPPVGGPKSGDENTISSQTVPLMSGSVYFDGLQFDDALQTVSNLLVEADTAEADMQLIADMYFDLLSSVPDCNETDSACLALDQMCFEALHGYKSAVEVLFKEEALTIDENQASFQPTVQAYASTLMAFTDSVKTPENHSKQFDLEMMKVSLFRGIQKYDQALSILINMEQCEHDSIREVIIDSQIQNILFDQHVHSEGVSYDLENESSFELDSSLFHLYAQSIIDTSGFGSYIIGPNNLMFTHCEIPSTPKKSKVQSSGREDVEIFPNPTVGDVQVHLNIPDFSSNDAAYLFTLHDLSGRIVFSERLRNSQQTVVLPDLQRSIYISSVSRGDERIFRGKLTVM